MRTHNIPLLKYKKKISPDYSKSSWGLKKEFEIAVVNEPSVFEPLKLYCIFLFCVYQNS